MRFSRMRLWVAGVVAFLMGFPFSEKVEAQVGDIFGASIGLGLAIADLAGNS